MKIKPLIFIAMGVALLVVGINMKDAQNKRSGSANLNSAISGNSGHYAGPKPAWRKGVFDGQEISAA